MLVIIILCLIILFIFSNFKIKEKYNNIVPLKIYTHWNTKFIPEKMKENVESLKKDNPEFEVIVYDNIEARNFISKYFDKEVLVAFDCLIPHSYKSDLFRYCILYIYGGIYIDIKFKCINNFKFINIVDKELWVQDLDKIGVLTGLIIKKSKDPILLKCIKEICYNVQNRIYGNNPLYPTGPHLLAKFFTEKDKNNLEYILSDKIGYINITYKKNNTSILKYYDEYRKEQKNIENKENTKHYDKVWREKNIYCK